MFLFISGNQHLKRVAVCNCESHAETLIRANYWPGTPEKTMVGFHFKLMDLAVVLFLHNQVPLRDFAEMIMELAPKLQPILVNIFTLCGKFCADLQTLDVCKLWSYLHL